MGEVTLSWSALDVGTSRLHFSVEMLRPLRNTYSESNIAITLPDPNEVNGKLSNSEDPFNVHQWRNKH